MVNIDACVQAAKKTLNLFTEKELKQYVTDVTNRARDENISIEEAQKLVGDDEKRALFELAQISANNERKFSRLKDDIDSGKASIREMLVRRYKNMSTNVESAQKAATGRLMDSMFKELTPEDIKYLQDKNNNSEIADAMDGRKRSPIAQKIADKFNHYLDERTSEIVTSNALPLENIRGDRYLKAIHDRSKLAAGPFRKFTGFFKGKKYDSAAMKQAWMSEIKKRLDIDKTFKHTGAIDIDGNVVDSEVDKILSSSYDNIVSGQKEIFTKTGVLTDLQAVKARTRMFFVWKDMKSFTDYNAMYGHGDLFSSLMSDIHSSGNNIGMAELFGSAPSQMYEALKRVKPSSKLTWWDTNDWIFKYVNGTTKVAKDPALASIAANIRSYAGMARLGGIVLQSLSDANIAASYASRFHINYGEQLVKQLSGVLKNYSQKEQSEFGKAMHLELKHHMGYIGKFADANNISEMTGKISSFYYRKIGMTGWDNGNREAIMSSISRRLAKEKTTSFDLLHPKLQQQLTNFNITPKEWRALREKSQHGYFTTDNVNSLSNDELKQLYNKSDKSVPLSEYRSDLYRKVFSMLDVASDNAILTPGAYQQAILGMGTQPGTIPGELIRMITQFKGFPLTYIDRALVGGYKNANTTQAKFMWALQNFGYVGPLSYLSAYMYNLGQGVTMPDLSRLNTPEKISFAAQIMAPGFGVFAQILDPQSQNSNLLTSMMTSPSWRLLSNALSVPMNLIEGNGKGFKKTASKTAQYMVPGATIPFASPFIKKVLGDKQYLGPGQKAAAYTQ